MLAAEPKPGGVLLISKRQGITWHEDKPTSKLDVTYKTAGQTPLKLDLYYPAAPKAEDKFPLVIYLHGGGWAKRSKAIGDRGVLFLSVSALNAHGFCVASVDYRLWSKDGAVTIRDCVIDSKDALRFLAKNASQFHLDPNLVFTFGDSAGGHLAQMVLLSSPDSFPGDPTLADAQFRIVAGVSWYGPCDFEETSLFTPPGKDDVGDIFGRRIIKGTPDASARIAAYREVSPVNYLSPSSPPLLMLQGDKDTVIPVHHAHYMKERAKIVQASVEVLIVENAEHNWRESGGSLQPGHDEIITASAEFMKTHLNSKQK
jgi:acetyl esterase/lipase